VQLTGVVGRNCFNPAQLGVAHPNRTSLAPSLS
jgi:hypothetical protein